MRSLLLFLLLLTAAARLDASELGCAMVAHWGSRGIETDFVISGTHLFSADGRGVTVYDVSDPKLIRQLHLATSLRPSVELTLAGSRLVVRTDGGVELFEIEANGALRLLSVHPGATTHIASSQSHLAVASGAEIVLYRIGADGTLVFVARSSTPAPVSALALAGNLLAAGRSGSGMQLFDIGGGRLAPMSTLPLFAEAIALMHERALVAGRGALHTVDLRDPARPSITGEWRSESAAPRKLSADGEIIAASDGRSGIIVFDVSSGTDPVALARIETPSSAIAFSGGLLFAGGPRFDHFGLERPASSISVFDVSAPVAPERAAAWGDAATAITGVALAGSIAYVPDPPLLRVLDFAAAPPRQIATLAIPSNVDRVRLSGHRLLLFGREAVEIVDVSQPRSPIHVGSWPTLGRPRSEAAFAGDLLIEANHASGFHVVDMSNPARPTQIGGLKNDGFGAFNGMIATLPSVVYAGIQLVVKVIDISTPHSPQFVEVIPVSTVDDLEVLPKGEGRPPLLLLLDEGVLRLFDITSPLRPVEAGSVAAASGTMAAHGDDVWIATPSGRLLQIDVADAARPRLVDSLEGLTSPSQLSVSGPLLAVADRHLLRLLHADRRPVVPPAPEVEITRRTARTAQLSWSGAAGSFEIETSNGDDFAEALRTRRVETTIELPLASDLFVRVRGVDGCSAGAWSNVVALERNALGMVVFEQSGATVVAGENGAVTTIAIANRGSESRLVTIDADEREALELPQSVTIGGGERIEIEIEVSSGAAAGTRVLTTSEGESSFELRIVRPVIEPRPLVVDGGLILAGIGRTAGAEGTSWRSDLHLFCDRPQCEVALTYVAYGSTDGLQARFGMQEGEIITLEDLVGSLFGRDSTSGFVVAAKAEGLSIWGETWNGAAGRFGQAIQPVALDDLSGGLRFLPALRIDARSRTNIGLLNLGETGEAIVVARDAAGNERDRRVVPLAARSSLQVPLDTMLPGVPRPFAGTVEVTTPRAVLAWASRVEQETGDAVFIHASEAVDSEGGVIVDPITAVPGAAGSHWRSELQLVNPMAEPVDMILTFIPTSGDPVHRPLSLAPRASVVAEDAIAELFPSIVLPASGTLRIDSPQPVIAWSRIYNDAPGGRFGQAVPARVPGSATRRNFFPLADDARTRVNLGFAETSGAGGEHVLRLYDAHGLLVHTLPLTLSPYRPLSLPSLLRGAGLGVSGKLRAELSSTAPSTVLGYASIVRNATGDAVLAASE